MRSLSHGYHAEGCCVAPPKIHKLRKKKKSIVLLLRKEIMNKLVVDLMQQKG